MTRFITIASGKGGTGKTTVAVNLGVAMRNLGFDVVVLDANLTTPDIGLYLGVPEPPITLNDVISEENSVHQATYVHSSGMKIIPGSICFEKIREPNYEKLKHVFKQLQGTTEIVLVDSAAGLGKETTSTFDHHGEVLIVTNPDLVSATDAVKTIKFAEENGTTVIGTILNKIKNDKVELSINNVEAILGMPIIAEIPFSDDIRKSQQKKHPVAYLYPSSIASISFKRLATKLAGSGIP